MNKELQLFLNKISKNDKDRVVRFFTNNFTEKVTPVYCLKDGAVDGNVFLATTWCKTTLKKKIKKYLNINARLKEGTFSTRFETFAGYWIEFVS